MTSGLIVLVAISTAAVIVVVAVLLSKLVHTVVDSASGLPPAAPRFRGLLGRRFSRKPVTVRPSTEAAAWLARVESIGDPAVPAREEREQVLAADEASPTPVPDEPAVAVPAHVQPRRRVKVKWFSGAIDERDPHTERDPVSYDHVGEQVTAVLTAAEQAAAEIRETALRDAEQTRRGAEEQAAAILAEAQIQSAETERENEETRAAAEAHAETTRRRTDEEAARAVSEAQEEARVIRAEAEQRARQIEAEAVLRLERLTTTVDDLEDRVESTIGVFRRTASELEKLLPVERRSDQHERLDEALKPSSPRGELNSRADD